MGMTIDKAIEFFNGLECHTPQAKDARDVAIDTMRRYQKIQQIVEDYQRYSRDCLINVREIIGDGHDEQRGNA